MPVRTIMCPYGRSHCAINHDALFANAHDFGAMAPIRLRIGTPLGRQRRCPATAATSTGSRASTMLPTCSAVALSMLPTWYRPRGTLSVRL